MSTFKTKSTRDQIYKDNSIIEPSSTSWNDFSITAIADLITVKSLIFTKSTFINVLIGIISFLTQYYSTVNSQIKSLNLQTYIITSIILFPLVFAISSSFTRREQAIEAFTNIKTSLLSVTNNLFMHEYKLSTDVEKHNEFYKNLMKINFKLIDTIKAYLQIESLNTPYQFFTKKGQRLKESYDEGNAHICSQILWLIKQLSLSIDLCRREGLSPPLCNGLNIQTWNIMINFGTLRRVKEYSTPFAMKSLSRILIFALSIIYAPAFVQIKDTSGSLGLALFFNIVSITGITCIYNILESIDSPFDEKGMDDVRITSDTLQFKNDINLLSIYSDVTQTYDAQDDLDKVSKVILVRKRATCKKHKRQYNKNPEDYPRICQHNNTDSSNVHIKERKKLTEDQIFDEQRRSSANTKTYEKQNMEQNNESFKSNNLLLDEQKLQISKQVDQMNVKKSGNRRDSKKYIVDNIKDKDHQKERGELQNDMIDYKFDENLLINNDNHL